eukprot:CAMPEP_0194781026 /NCGR_PEP_ID=MMETSP0323_2-20130528/75133_1 /TAXON_ID=2866 ORGANISM="Crypthecodinium cohnii, Strain Seligo" /NCGR_SAMPLE_ID=MMETSP0323_2 /ASSEMBLY_ACC=CAM_ASM_000346 /LENGTH=123 /DNA_ID=CAMNT_0039719249 /DNA_START=51 /DNA_END=423 /DNA_ORIENTATION=-
MTHDMTTDGQQQAKQPALTPIPGDFHRSLDHPSKLIDSSVFHERHFLLVIGFRVRRHELATDFIGDDEDGDTHDEGDEELQTHREAEMFVVYGFLAGVAVVHGVEDVTNGQAFQDRDQELGAV